MLLNDIAERLRGPIPSAPPRVVPDRRMAFCKHEAAHALAALACGGRALKIWLLPSDWGGRARTQTSDPWHDLIVFCAGPAADEHFGWPRSDSDNFNIVTYARRVDSDQPGRAWLAAARAADDIIKENTHAIVCLGRHLYYSPNGELDEDEINRLISRFRPFSRVPEPPVPERIKRLFARRAISSDGEQLLYRTDGYLRPLAPAPAHRPAPEERIVRGPRGIIGRLVRTADGRFRALDNNGRCYGIFDDTTSGCKALPD